MKIRSELAILIIMELLTFNVFLFINDPLILGVLVIYAIIIIYLLYKLFSKNKKNEVIEKELNQIDYREIANIEKILNIDEQVERYFSYANTHINFLNQLFQNFTEEQKKEFIEKLILYCRKELSNASMDLQLENHAMVTLSMAIKYKRDFIKE